MGYSDEAHGFQRPCSVPTARGLSKPCIFFIAPASLARWKAARWKAAPQSLLKIFLTSPDLYLPAAPASTAAAVKGAQATPCPPFPSPPTSLPAGGAASEADNAWIPPHTKPSLPPTFPHFPVFLLTPLPPLQVEQRARQALGDDACDALQLSLLKYQFQGSWPCSPSQVGWAVS